MTKENKIESKIESSEQVVSIWLTVNGREVYLDIDQNASLAEILRDQLKLSGVRGHCGHKHRNCRGCTVLVNGHAVCSFKESAAELQGSEIITMEALIIQDELEQLQHGFFDYGYGKNPTTH